MPEEEEEYEAPEEDVNLVLPTYDEIKQTMTELNSVAPAAEAPVEDVEAEYDYW